MFCKNRSTQLPYHFAPCPVCHPEVVMTLPGGNIPIEKPLKVATPPPTATTGWVCPICHSGVAPSVVVCPCKEREAQNEAQMSMSDSANANE